MRAGQRTLRGAGTGRPHGKLEGPRWGGTSAGGQDPGGPGCGWGRGVGLKSCARAGGGAKVWPRELGGGARKFRLSVEWLQIVDPDFRGWGRGQKVVGGRGGARVLAGHAEGGVRKFCRVSERPRGRWGRGQNLGGGTGGGAIA